MLASQWEDKGLIAIQMAINIIAVVIRGVRINPNRTRLPLLFIFTNSKDENQPQSRETSNCSDLFPYKHIFLPFGPLTLLHTLSKKDMHSLHQIEQVVLCHKRTHFTPTK